MVKFGMLQTTEIEHHIASNQNYFCKRTHDLSIDHTYTEYKVYGFIIL